MVVGTFNSKNLATGLIMWAVNLKYLCWRLSLRFRTVKEDGKEDGVDDLGINLKLESL